MGSDVQERGSGGSLMVGWLRRLGRLGHYLTEGKEKSSLQEDEHLLRFVMDAAGTMVSIHANLSGVNLLLRLRDELLKDDCRHTHLFSSEPDLELTTTELANQEAEVSAVWHVKIYGWNAAWAARHGLTNSAS